MKASLSYLLILIVVGISLRLPLVGTIFYRTDDATEFINVGKNIYLGKGLTQSIKFRYFDEEPVVTSAFKGRTLMMGVIVATLLHVYNNLYFLQIFSLLTGIINALLVFAILRRLVPDKFAFLGGLLAVINPNLLINSRQVLSEPVFTFFLISSLWVYWFLKESVWKYFFIGSLIGLAYLTRLEGIFMLFVFGVLLRKDIRNIIILGGTFVLVTAPYFLGNYLVNGNPFYTNYAIHFRVFSLREGLEGAYGKHFPTAGEFISRNYLWIIRQIVINMVGHLRSLAEFGYFGPLIIIVILGLRKGWKKFWYLGIFSAMLIGLYALLWSGMFERTRHFTAVYLLLLIPVVVGLYRMRKVRVLWGLVFITMAAYLVLDIHRIAWARNVDLYEGRWVYADRVDEYEWIKKNTGTDEIISTTHSPIVNIFTERPAILTPGNLNGENYDHYVKHFQVKYFLVDNESEFNFYDQRTIRLADFYNGARMYQVLQDK